MAAGDVIIRLSVQDAEAVRAWQRAKKGIADMQQEMSRTKQAYAAASTTGIEMVDKMFAGFTRMAAGAFSVHKAVAMAREEYEALIAREKAAASHQVSLAAAQRSALRNLSGTEYTPIELKQKVQQIASETGADENAVWQATGNVLSARGALSEKEAMTELQATARLDPSLVNDEMAQISGAALDLRKAFGGDAQMALGAMITSQQTARLTTTQDFATNAAPALMSLAQFGDSFREASSLFATITQQSADVTGRRSGTAAIRFAQQLAEATATVEQLKDASTAARREWLLSGASEAESIRRRLLGTMQRDYEDAETHEAAEADPTRKAELHAEAKQFLSLLQLLEKGSPTSKAYAQTYAATPEWEQAGERYEQNIRDQRAIGLQAAEVSEMGRAAVQKVQSNERDALVGQAREELQKLLDSIGPFGTTWAGWAQSKVPTLGATGAFGEFNQKAEWGARFKSNQAALDAIADIAEERLKNAREDGTAVLEENKEKVAALEQFAAKARKLADELFEQERQANAARMRQSPPVPVPSALTVPGETQYAVGGPRRQPEQKQADGLSLNRAAARPLPADLDELLTQTPQEARRELSAEERRQLEEVARGGAGALEPPKEVARRAAETSLEPPQEFVEKSPAGAAQRPKAERARLPQKAVARPAEVGERAAMRRPGERSMDVARQAADRADAAVLDDERQLDELRDKRRQTDKSASDAEQRRTQAQIDNLSRRLEADQREAERRHRELADLLTKIAGNTADKEVTATIKNPGDPSRAARRASPPAPVIGG